MRIEYTFDLDKVDVPRFSVEASEGPDKLFKLSTLVLNVLSEAKQIDVIFHSPNQSDLPRKIESFERILGSAPHAPSFVLKEGDAGSLGSSYFRWVRIERS